ncbi:MAG: chorismate mutase [Candidatus Altiarchaeota archaeon]
MTYEKEIEIEREKIDEIDNEIIKKILERVKICGKIGEIKKKYNVPVSDTKRERAILNKVKEISLKRNLPSRNFMRIFRDIISLCRNKEK